MTSLGETLGALEKVKATLARERREWKVREVELVEEAARARRDLEVAAARAGAAAPSETPGQVRQAALDEALGVVENVRMHAAQAADRWASKDAGERDAASRQDRMWAHPFVYAAIGVIAIKLEELKEKS